MASKILASYLQNSLRFSRSGRLVSCHKSGPKYRVPALTKFLSLVVARPPGAQCAPCVLVHTVLASWRTLHSVLVIWHPGAHTVLAAWRRLHTVLASWRTLSWLFCPGLSCAGALALLSWRRLSPAGAWSVLLVRERRCWWHQGGAPLPTGKSSTLLLTTRAIYGC